MDARYPVSFILSSIILLSGCRRPPSETRGIGKGLLCRLSSESGTYELGKPFVIKIEVENRGSKPVDVAVRGPSWVQAQELLEQGARSEASLRAEISRTEKRIAEAETAFAKATGSQEQDKARDLLTVAHTELTNVRNELEKSVETKQLARKILAGALPLGSFEITDTATGQTHPADVASLWCGTGVANAPMSPGMKLRYRCRMDSHWFFDRPGTYDFVFHVIRRAGDSYEDAVCSPPFRIKFLPTADPQSLP